MSQEQIQLVKKTQQLLHGPLKHVRAAALAAALLPLASVAVSPASAQSVCPSGGTMSGVVWNDMNQNGIQDAGEPGIAGAVVTLGGVSTATDANGFYSFDLLSLGYVANCQVAVQIPPGGQPSPGTILCENDSTSVCATPNVEVSPLVANFGFSQTTVFPNPGTGTPGYWKNHPEAWPVEYIKIGYTTLADGTKVGGTTYSKLQALGWLESVPKDKRTTMFSSLVPAMLNVILGNDPRCVQDAIRDANTWMSTRLPMEDATKKVAASSAAWKVGEPLHQTMDNYNNGGLCAPHRD